MDVQTLIMKSFSNQTIPLIHEDTIGNILSHKQQKIVNAEMDLVSVLLMHGTNLLVMWYQQTQQINLNLN